jgi:penicillin amidase
MRPLLFASITIAIACESPVPPPETYALGAEVEVFRDSLGVVHIYAESDEDVLYASGYMQAYDRLFQMDLARRRALGRQSEVLGEGSIGDDTLLRTVGIARWADEAVELMQTDSPEEYRLLVAWTSGVNARIAEVNAGEAPLPYGFGPDELDYAPEEWEPRDGVAIGKLLLFGNANQLEFDLLATIIRDYIPEAFERVPLMEPLVPTFVLPPEERPGSASEPIVVAPPRVMPELPADARLDDLFDIVPSITDPFASNNWALDGRHTENGRPMIAGDPHQPIRSPSLFWMQHMNSADAGGTFDVVGFSFVGTPTVQLGHNRHIAWTATTSYPDISDLWEVRANSSSINAGGEQIPIVAHEETLMVRDSDPVTITIEEVPGYGVLLPDDIAPIPVVRTGRRLLYNWTGFRPTTEGQAFLALDRAEDLDDFEAAVDRIELGCFNFVAASADGISYRSSPLVPDRGPGATTRQHWALLDGDDPSTFWSDQFLDLDRMPHSRGGERGWIASANNDPLGLTEDGATEGDPYYFGVFFDPGTRSARIEQRLTELTERGDVTTEEMQALQMDAYSVLADILVPVLEEAWAAVPTDETLAEFRDREELETLITLITTDWDRTLTRDQSGAVAFDIFAYFAASNALADDLPLVFNPILGQEPMYMMKWAANTLRRHYPRADELMTEGRDLLVMRALDGTAAWLTDRYGGVDPSLYTWGDHHGTRFRSDWGDRTAGDWVPTDGGIGTVNVSSASFLNDAGTVMRLESTSGALYRMVAGFGDDGAPLAEVTVARGNSGDPDSPFLANTTDDWVNGRYVPLLFTRGAIDADVQETWTLAP